MVGRVVVLESRDLVQPQGSVKHSRCLLSALGHYAWFVLYRTRFFFYRATGADFNHVCEILREGMSRALVHFYPAAGRLLVRADGRMELDCSGQGVYFAKASAPGIALTDIEGQDGKFDCIPLELLYDLSQIADFDLKWPWPADAPLFFTQVTRFACGGICIAIRFSHQLMDGTSAFNFFRAWAQECRGESSEVLVPDCSEIPLRIMAPPPAELLHTSGSLTICKRSQLCRSEDMSTIDKYGNRGITFSKATIERLKERFQGFTTFQLVTSLLWHWLTRARSYLVDDDSTRLLFAMNCRGRINWLSKSYFGQGAVVLPATLRVSDLRQDFVKGAVAIREVVQTFDQREADSVVKLVESFAGDSERTVFPGFNRGKDLNVGSSFYFPVYEDFGPGIGAADGMTILPVPSDARVYYFPGKRPGSIVAYFAAPADILNKLLELVETDTMSLMNE